MSTTAVCLRRFSVPWIRPGPTAAICQPSDAPAFMIAVFTCAAGTGFAVTIGASLTFWIGCAPQLAVDAPRQKAKPIVANADLTLRILHFSLYSKIDVD